MSVNLFGAPSSLKSASTDTGSVAEMSEPKRSATRKGMGIPKNPKRKQSPVPIMSAETKSETTERRLIDQRLFIISLNLML